MSAWVEDSLSLSFSPSEDVQNSVETRPRFQAIFFMFFVCFFSLSIFRNRKAFQKQWIDVLSGCDYILHSAIRMKHYAARFGWVVWDSEQLSIIQMGNDVLFILINIYM